MCRKIGVILVATAVLALCGCAEKRHSFYAPSDIDILERYDSDGHGPASLFKGDSEVLSDEDIARILAFELKLGQQNRLAVVKLQRTRYWSEAHARAAHANIATFLRRFRAVPTVTHAAELPQLLVPAKQTVPLLREAAARYQADLLIVYNTDVRTFPKYRALRKDEVRALCSVDMILLDVRTGIVPLTAHESEEVVSARSSDDFDFDETIAKAVAAAEGKALLRIAQETVRFLRGKR